MENVSLDVEKNGRCFKTIGDFVFWRFFSNLIQGQFHYEYGVKLANLQDMRFCFKLL